MLTSYIGDSNPAFWLTSLKPGCACSRRRDETDVSWSPDGKRLVLSSYGPSVDIASLYVIGAGGGTRKRVTKARRYYDGAPAWPPDGRTIAFESRRGEPDDSPGTRLWTITAPAPC